MSPKITPLEVEYIPKLMIISRGRYEPTVAIGGQLGKVFYQLLVTARAHYASP